MGSPPPMRGKEDHSDRQYLRGGITPAYAGKRQQLMTNSRSRQDHPRLCGEKLKPCPFCRTEAGSPRLCGEKRRNTFQLTSLPGSPPPMRGKGICDTLQILCKGITPAYAGKSNTFFIFWCTQEDHPRLCGEKYPLSNAFDKTARITPAYAGKREIYRQTKNANKDHPRLCGEKLFDVWRSDLQLGSPPPMRGKV